MQDKLTIGIDPGKQTGVAIMTGRRLTTLATLDFWQAFEMVSGIAISRVAAVIIEDTGKLPVFAKNRDASTWGAVAMTGRRIGAVCREADLLAEGLERAGYPVRRKARNAKTPKMSARQFRQLTGWMGRTNQHERDSAMLCF